MPPGVLAAEAPANPRRTSMAGYYEVRATGPGREQFRLFCVLEKASLAELGRRGLARPAIVVLTGMRKPWRTTFGDREYRALRPLDDDHRSSFPRRIAE